MAHEILPQHVSHDQLRTEAPVQRTHSDKYISAYISSDNHVDMSFSNPILKESADHFKVGIDEFTINLQHLSMLEFDPSGTNELFRFRRLGTAIDAADFLPTATLRDACSFRINRAYTSFNDIKVRIDQICRTMNQYIDASGLVDAAGTTYNVTIPPGVARLQRMGGVTTEFIVADIDTAGRLKFRGNSIFWANFCIEVREPKYQYLLLGDLSARMRTVNPQTTGRFVGINPNDGSVHDPYTLQNDGTVVVRAFDPVLTAGGRDVADWREDVFTTGNFLSVTGTIDCVRALDRRVGVELGCSLPIKNSPMYDHGQESPDFVLYRHNFANAYEADPNTEQDYVTLNYMMGTKRLQGPTDRVCYHHLGPQQKIQALRLRLWARVRTYNADTKKFGMQTIMFPTRASDYWFVKLHFLHKDSAAY